ncbi:MAG: PPC domain-containing DNA-binding protein [Gammaproteobacteria bacterium]
MQTLPLRLDPGVDLRAALEGATSRHGAGFVLAGIGSLSGAALRFADQPIETAIDGPLEVISLCGSLGADGAHLHMAVSDAVGRVWGGHVGYGNIVRTTMEVLLAILPDWSLGREQDPATGFKELVVRRR